MLYAYYVMTGGQSSNDTHYEIPVARSGAPPSCAQGGLIGQLDMSEFTIDGTFALCDTLFSQQLMGLSTPENFL